VIAAFRICHTRYANTIYTGRGGLLKGSRFLPAGYAVLYASASRALAVLEYAVHDETYTLRNLVIGEIGIPDDITMLDAGRVGLPEGWNRIQGSQASRAFGEQWIKDDRHAILKVPSIIIEDEANFIMNTQHRDFSRLELGEPRLFDIDKRLDWLKDRTGSEVIERVREHRGRQWMEDNREALKAYNEFVEKHSVFSDGLCQF
jgi:RES domain-containing protein